MYRSRRVAAEKIFDYIGAEYSRTSQGLFLWGKVGPDAEKISDKILYEAGVFITPGFIFGRNGSQYLRISLCADVEVFEEALARIKEVI